MSAELEEVQRSGRRVAFIRGIILLAAALLVLVYVVVIIPLQRFAWIVNAVDANGGLSARLDRVNGGPGWLREMVGDEWMYGFDEITLLRMTVQEPFETERLLSHLGPQASLAKLTLSGSDTCDDEFGRLACLPGLERLNLCGEILSDRGLEHLSACDALEELRLKEMSITDSGVAHLASLPSLQILELTDCPGVTDESVVSIAGIETLCELSLSGPGITSASMETLSGMNNLRSLRLTDTEVTEEAAIQLAEDLPECAIYWNDSVFSKRLINVLF